MPCGCKHRAYCTPECHPTWGYHQTCWRQFPPLQPCCGWGSYCPANGACQPNGTCQSCQAGGMPPNSVVQNAYAPGTPAPSEIFMAPQPPATAIPNTTEVVQPPPQAYNNTIVPAPQTDSVGSPPPQVYSPTTPNVAPGQNVPGINSGIPPAQTIQSLPTAPTPLHQNQLPPAPQQQITPEPPVPNQTYNITNGQPFYSASARNTYSTMSVGPVTYQNPIPSSTAVQNSFPHAEKPSWTTRARTSASKAWNWFRRSPTPPQQQQNASPSLGSRLTSWAR